MMRLVGSAFFYALVVALIAPPAAAQSAQQCEPVMYHSSDPDCWGQYSAHADFTTEFDVRVDRVWTETPQEAPGFNMLYIDVTRQDTGQQLLLKCGWWSSENKASAKCFDLDAGATYRVRAGHGYGYVYVRQPIDGTQTWLETSCDLTGEAFCLP